MTLKENPLTVSVGFLICVALFIPVFIQVGIELCRSREMTDKERRTTLTDEERRKLVADLLAVANEDEERQKLCKILRTMEPWPCKEAANEIERLAKEVETLKAQQREVRPPFYF